MRYVPVDFIEDVEVGKDLMGNPVTERRIHHTPYQARSSGLEIETAELDGRDVTENAPEIWTDAPPEKLRKILGIRLGTDDFRILHIYARLRGKWSIAILERWRQT